MFMVAADGGDLGSAMQLVIETDNGVAVRNISPAMPRRLREGRGKEAENATHDAAAIWGLADFVFEPAVRQKPSGVRELGDGMLVLGDLCVVLQVKSREGETEDADRERRWIEKQCRKALAQGAGTVRELHREPALMKNLRGRSITLDGKERRCIVVVIVDHDSPPEKIRIEPGSDAVILLRRDWDFLFEQLKSIHGVGHYLDRVVGEANDLGDEPIRYYELAALDAESRPRPLRPELMIPGAVRVTEPMLPMAPAATVDRDEHGLFRSILEDIASIRLRDMPEEIRLKALAELDSLPTESRAAAGRFLLDALDEADGVESPAVLWRHRRIFGLGSTQLGVSVCSQHNEELVMAFRSWVELRHHEFTGRVGADDAITVGVLLTPRVGGRRRWDTTMTAVRGDIALEPGQLSVYEEIWNEGRQAAA